MSDERTTNAKGIKMSHTAYYPEMNETKPANTQIEARIGHYGSWYVSTPLTLKGRGITFLKTIRSEELVDNPIAQRRAGWNEYRVTDMAFDKLKTQYVIATESLL